MCTVYYKSVAIKTIDINIPILVVVFRKRLVNKHAPSDDGIMLSNDTI